MQVTLQELYVELKKLSVKADLTGKEALEAVKQDRGALRYVKEQIFLLGVSIGK